jgi:N-acetylglucosaminyl-diphospho-decaprenol L-rhamnosyltransferase
VRPTVYIPTFEARHLLGRVLGSLAEQTTPADVVVVDNGSSDGSAELVRADFPDVAVVSLERNLGFGPAINRAVEERPGDPVILVNNDAECRPDFLEALLDGAGDAEMAAGVLLAERDPDTIDSAGVVADRTLMAFDYMHGEPVSALAGAAAPLGPTGGAALYRLEPLRAVGGFDERIFLYLEDVDLALRLAAAGGLCRLVGEAQALHAYSASLGAASGRKYARTGWSRGYMLRRYGILSSPGAAARALACEGAICAGQILRDRTAKGLTGRIRGWREGAGLERREADGAPLLEISAAEALRMRRRRRG